MRQTVRSAQGRLHLALTTGTGWVGLCGCVIHKPQEITPTDYGRLTSGAEPSCRYCRAIAAGIQHEQLLAAESAAEWGSYVRGMAS